MKRAQGSKDVEPIVCLNPVKGLWRVRMDITETDDGAEWLEHDFDHRPTANEIKALYVELVNEEVQRRILEGFFYKHTPVWLSIENQFDYTGAFLLATQTNGRNLPVTFKFGTDEFPVLTSFQTIEELTDFYSAMNDHINECVAEGWERKALFDVEPYLRE